VRALVPPLPRDLQVEVTSACNLRCAMCLVRYRPPVNKVAGAIDVDLFRRLIDDLPDLAGVTLQGLGEPLLHPRLLDLVGHTHQRGIRVGFNSNATLLTRERSQQLVRAGLDWVHVSVDGATAQTYESIREGARLPVVLRNLADLVAVRREDGRGRLEIRVVFVAMRRNIGELPRLVAQLNRIGITDLRVQNLSHDFADTDPAGSYREIREYAHDQALWEDDPETREAFAAAEGVAAARGVALRLPRTTGRTVAAAGGPGCTWPWDSAYITSAGVVQPCCMVMGDDRVSLGRLTERSFPEIWADEPYVEFRRRLLSGPPPEVCRGCSLYRGIF
jgi:radical SAM protein with 4Fe4S-binding SPASM domain